MGMCIAIIMAEAVVAEVTKPLSVFNIVKPVSPAFFIDSKIIWYF
jgi:hypothetical protein